MRSLPLAFLAALTLLSPAAALADPVLTVVGAAAPASNAGTQSRSFEIRGLVLGDVQMEVSGKLSINGNQLSASAGCNFIGGTVTVDGDSVTIVGPTYMTQMACPGTDDAEAMLLKVLALTTFKITDGAWIADGGQIVMVEIPITNPGPNAPAPDEPISTGVPTIVDPAPSALPADGSCPPIPGDNTSTSVGGGSAAGSSGGSGGGSSATAGTGATGPGTTVGTGPGVEPGATGIEVPPPAPDPARTFELGQVEPAPPFVVAPPPLIGTDPGVGKPADPCLAYVAGSSQSGAGDAVPSNAIDTAAESGARDAASESALFVPILLVLGVVLLLGIRRIARAVPTRR